MTEKCGSGFTFKLSGTAGIIFMLAVILIRYKVLICNGKVSENVQEVYGKLQG